MPLRTTVLGELSFVGNISMVIGIGFYKLYLKNKENFKNNEYNKKIFSTDDLDYYVITMGQENRLKNTQEQLDKLNKERKEKNQS